MAHKNDISAASAFEEYKDSWIGEIEQDLIDLTAVKPELTTLFIGPPRKDLVDFNKADGAGLIEIKNGFADYSGKTNVAGLIPLGAVQSISYSISRQQAPIGFIGSSMKTFASGDSTIGQGGIQNLVTPKNLIYKIQDYFNVINNYLGRQNNSGYSDTIDLDTIIGEVPFGLAIVEYNKSNNPVGKQYLENCKLVSVSRGISAGQALIFESMSFMFHRAVDFGVNPNK